MTARPIPFPARPHRAGLALVAVLGLMLAACGGGGGGGGGDGAASDFSLKVVVVNETTDTIDVSLDTPSEVGEPTSIDTCKAKLITYAIPLDDWTLMVNGQTAIDSVAMADNLFDKNLIAQFVLNDDGSLTEKLFSPGTDLNVPAAFGICT